MNWRSNLSLSVSGEGRGDVGHWRGETPRKDPEDEHEEHSTPPYYTDYYLLPPPPIPPFYTDY